MRLFFLAFLFCSAGAFGVGYSAAEEVGIPDVSEAFQTVVTIPVIEDIVVPTVVEIPLASILEEDYTTVQKQVVVQNSTTKKLVPIYQYTTGTYNPTPLMITESSRTIPALTDNDIRTTADFPLVNDEPTVTTLTITPSVAITSSELRLTLAPNVALPTHVKISTSGHRDGPRTVVATRTLRSLRIPFPQTMSPETWIVELTHSQPLRLSEVALVEDGRKTAIEYFVRFLAQPNQSYQLYANPDRRLTLPPLEAGDYRRNEGVRSNVSFTVEENPVFTQADSDGDGVADMFDNCVSVPNQDQADIDDNGRGDMCDDWDRDTIRNSLDNCPAIPNRRQLDEDEDGIGDVCDGEESRVTERYPWIPWLGLILAALLIGGMFYTVTRQKN